MRRVAVSALVLLMVAAFGGVAAAQPPAGAGAEKSALFESETSFTCEEGATDTDGARYGFVVLNTNAKGNLIVQVSLKRAEPNTTYDIWVNQNPGACPLVEATKVGAITTNLRGNGNGHVVVARVAHATVFWVSVTSEEDTFRSVAVELD